MAQSAPPDKPRQTALGSENPARGAAATLPSPRSPPALFDAPTDAFAASRPIPEPGKAAGSEARWSATLRRQDAVPLAVPARRGHLRRLPRAAPQFRVYS